MIALFIHLSDEDADTCVLILSAAGIVYQITGRPGDWSVSVPEADVEKALFEIKSYFIENREVPETEDAWRHIPRQAHHGMAAALVLPAFQIFINHHGGVSAFTEKFGASAAAILSGEFYRCVTALMIHADPVHLVGNMVSLAFFFSVVCSVQGAGVGSFGVLASGALGNYITAWLYQTHHVSIGASTAVFGAVGILISHQTFRSFRTPSRRIRAWLPLGCGLCLLALFSEGRHTDIMAHLFGLSAGAAVGSIFEIFFRKPPAPFFQNLFFFLTAAAVLLAWLRCL